MYNVYSENTANQRRGVRQDFHVCKAGFIVTQPNSNKYDFFISSIYTSAFTYYYDPAILRNTPTPLSIFRDLALRKRDSKNLIVY